MLCVDLMYCYFYGICARTTVIHHYLLSTAVRHAVSCTAVDTHTQYSVVVQSTQFPRRTVAQSAGCAAPSQSISPRLAVRHRTSQHHTTSCPKYCDLLFEMTAVAVRPRLCPWRSRWPCVAHCCGFLTIDSYQCKVFWWIWRGRVG